MLKCPKCYNEHLIRHGYTEAGNTRYECKECKHRTVRPLGLNHVDDDIDQSVVSKNIRESKRVKRWVVTSAQNATPVHAGFLEALENYCEVNDAQLLVLPYRYRNPTSIFTDSDHDWWDTSVVPYLMDQRITVCDGLTILGDVKVQPTAQNPLSGMEGFTGTNSCIIAHPKYEMRSVATTQGHMAKIMTTTGSVTLENYTPSKAGKKGHHHHCFGASVVEHDGENFFIRQINADKNGNFYEWDKYYTRDGVEDYDSCLSLTMGDVHHWWLDEDVDKAIDGVIAELNPEHLILHDVIDSFSISHHHSSPFVKYAKRMGAKDSIFRELTDFCSWAKEKTPNLVIVPSNHHEHIKRWVEETDWRNDPVNAQFYLETALYMLKNSGIDEGGASVPDPFAYWMGKMLPQATVLRSDESFMLGDVEHGIHGHVGPNGARGSLNAFSKMGKKITHGHCHSPGVKESAYAVGVSSVQMNYARGPSGWLQCHCIQYPNGKRTLFTTINGKYKA